MDGLQPYLHWRLERFSSCSLTGNILLLLASFAMVDSTTFYYAGVSDQLETAPHKVFALGCTSRWYGCITDGNIQTFLDLEILIGQSWVHCNKIENSGSKAATEVPPFAWTERPQQ